MVYGLILLLFSSHIVWPSSIGEWLLFLVTASLGVCWGYLFQLIIGASGFWLTQSRGFINFTGVIGRIFGGVYAPLSFFPDWFTKIAGVTPFPYQRYFPIAIWLGKATKVEVIMGIITQLVWIGVFYLLLMVVWRKGMKRYESIGI